MDWKILESVGLDASNRYILAQPNFLIAYLTDKTPISCPIVRLHGLSSTLCGLQAE